PRQSTWGAATDTCESSSWVGSVSLFDTVASIGMWPTERIANAAPRGRERTTAKPVAAIRNPLVDCCCRELYDYPDGPTTRLPYLVCLVLRAPRIESIGHCPKRSLGLYADFGAFSGS